MKRPTARPTVLVALMLIGLLAPAMLACETRTAAPSGTEPPAPGATAADAPSGVEATQAPPKATEAPAQSPTLTSTATPTVVPAATPAPAPTAVPTPSPTAVPVPTPTPTAVPTPEARPTPSLVPTVSPTGASGTGFPWERDGLTDLERDALVSFQKLEVRNPAVAEVVRGFPWLADSITEDELWALFYLEIIARTTRSATDIPQTLAEAQWLTDGIASEDRLFLQEISTIRESSVIEAVLLAMRPGDLTPSTSTPTPVPTSRPVPSDFPWAQDGLTAIEREALDYLQHIEREHPPAFENVIGYQWLADGINEGERRFLCNVSQVAETSTAVAVVLSVSPTLSPPVDYLAGCPTNTPPPTPAPAPTTTPTPMPQPTSTPTPTPQPTSTPVLQPALDISPLRGSPGDMVSVTGTNFPGLATVSRIEIGGVSVIPPTPYSTTADGAFSASVVVPRLDVGTYHFVVTVGDRSSTATFSVVESATTAGEPVAAALAPLGANLLWVAHYDNPTGQWSVYDPSGTSSPDSLPLPPGQSAPSPSSIGALTHVVPRKVYWMNISRDATVTLGGTARTLTAGINSVSW